MVFRPDPPVPFSSHRITVVSSASNFFYIDRFSPGQVREVLTPRITLELPRFIVEYERLYGLLPTISPTAFKIYYALGSRLGSENSIVRMSIKDITIATGIKSLRTVTEGLNELERKLKLITRLGENVQREYLLNKSYIRRYEQPSGIPLAAYNIYQALFTHPSLKNNIVEMSISEIEEATGLNSIIILQWLRILNTQMRLITYISQGDQYKYLINYKHHPFKT